MATIKDKEIGLINQLFELNGYFVDSFQEQKQQIINNIRNDFPFTFGTGYITEKLHFEEVEKLNSKINTLDEQIKAGETSNNDLIIRLLQLQIQEVTNTLMGMFGAKRILRVKKENNLPFTEDEINLITDTYFRFH